MQGCKLGVCLIKKGIIERWLDKALTTEMVRAAFESDETKSTGLVLYRCVSHSTNVQMNAHSLAVTVLGLLQSRRVLDIFADRLLELLRA